MPKGYPKNPTDAKGKRITGIKLSWSKRQVDPILRFWQKVNIQDNGSWLWQTDGKNSCWLWQASCNAGGYGKFGVNRESVLAHRFVYEYFRGKISESLDLDHLCRNHLCVNPWHLEPVPKVVNIRRGEVVNSNRRRGHAITHCPKGHPYDEQNTYWDPKHINRHCKICRLERERQRCERRFCGRA